MAKLIFCTAALLLFAVGCNSEKAQPKAPEKPEAVKADAKKAEPAKAAAKAEPKKKTIEEGSPEAQATSAPANLASTGHFGAKFTLKDVTPVKNVFSKPDSFEGKTALISGKVSNVCTKKGCWFMIQDPAKSDESIRITMKDYGFFVPKDCAGKMATIEGTIGVKTLTEARRKHLAEDAGKDPSKVTGDVKELTIVANGVKIEG